MSDVQEPASGIEWPRDWNHLPAITDKQRFVLSLRYGLKDGIQDELDERASLMGISNQAVSRIEQRAMETLRRGLETEAL